MEIKIYKELLDKQQFFNFCQEQSYLCKKEVSKNMWDDDWKHKKNTLPYILEFTDRFNEKGEFFILYDKEKIVACGGVYISNFSNDVALAGVRTWVNINYRHNSLIKDYLLTEHKKWCINKNIKLIALSFNEYNKNIIKIFKRNRLGEKNTRINNRKPCNLFYNGLHEVEFPVSIQNTMQWVIYEKLDPDFLFDWLSIKFHNKL